MKGNIKMGQLLDRRDNMIIDVKEKKCRSLEEDLNNRLSVNQNNTIPKQMNNYKMNIINQNIQRDSGWQNICSLLG